VLICCWWQRASKFSNIDYFSSVTYFLLSSVCWGSLLQDLGQFPTVSLLIFWTIPAWVHISQPRPLKWVWV